METRRPLLIRADASTSMGTGHVMRMIALAQAWQDRGDEPVFLCAEITPALEARLKEEGFLLEKIQASPGSREDLEATCTAIARYGADSVPVALDGYQFDADFQLGLKKAGCRLLVMDDYGHADVQQADWVLNQNISASREVYQTHAQQAQLLLGTKFALLRSEFLGFSSWERKVPEVARNILVTLGGADLANVTTKVVRSLAMLDSRVRVIVGGSNPHLENLRHAVEECNSQLARFELVVNSNEMPEAMAWADLAIAAGGSTAWELAFMGLPAFFFVLAYNQHAVAPRLEQKELGICLGDPSGKFDFPQLSTAVSNLARNQAKRQRFSIQGRKAVDGLGAQRVVSILNGAI